MYQSFKAAGPTAMGVRLYPGGPRCAAFEGARAIVPGAIVEVVPQFGGPRKSASWELEKNPSWAAGA
jgi:hypothetical protein